MKQIAIAIILFWTFSIIYKILSGYDSSIMQVEEILATPNFTYWFGKDDFGRDIYFRLVLIPLITIIGMQFGSLLSGAVITETIFSWDGLGRLLVTSIQTRDYPVTQACILIIASSYVFINFLTEVAYRFLDPRMRH